MEDTSPRSLVLVEVLDADDAPVCFAEVTFLLHGPESVHFPHPVAVTDGSGVAANYLERTTKECWSGVTEFVVAAGDLRTAPVRVIGTCWHTDASPFGFSAPPLAPFDGRRQRLLGLTRYFAVPTPIGREIRAWALDPRIAEPGAGRVIGTDRFADQLVLFEVFARQTGKTVFVLETIDTAIYEAVVEGNLDPEFVRGDCDGNGRADTADALVLLEYMFRGGAVPPVHEACNADDERGLDVTDAVYLLRYLLLGGPPPPAPFPERGKDPTP